MLARPILASVALLMGCQGMASPPQSTTQDAAAPDGTVPDATALDGASSADAMTEPAPGVIGDYLPNLPSSECALEQPFAPAFDRNMFRAVTVCESGCDHASFADALAAAQPMDEIRLAPGDYHDCIDIDVSPIAIVGDGGMARFVDVECQDEGSVFLLRSAHVRLENLRFEGLRRADGSGTAISLRDTVQAEITHVWVEDMDFVLGGGTDSGEVYLEGLKVKGVGFYDEPAEHQRPVISVSRYDRFWLTGSTFSHFTQRAWLLGSHDIPHVELVCNVVVKPGAEEGDHSLHVFFPERFVMRSNFFHESNGRIVLYNYDNGSDNELHLERNHFLFDAEDGDFVGVIQPSSVVTAIGNTTVGGVGASALEDRMTGEVRDNIHYADRAAAGMQDTGPIPDGWPLQRL